MKKIEIVEHIINNTNINRSQAIQAVDCVFDAIRNSLCRGESVYIRGFATIKTYTSKRKKARGILAREQQLLFQLNALPSSSLVNNLKLK